MTDERRNWLIYDTRSECFWGPNRGGYWKSLTEAGLYTEQEARAAQAFAERYDRHEVAVPLEQYRAAIERLAHALGIVPPSCPECGFDPTTAPPPYDRTFGDERLCRCGHPYYRHFDTYDGMRPVGCKYCECRAFDGGGMKPQSEVQLTYWKGDISAHIKPKPMHRDRVGWYGHEDCGLSTIASSVWLDDEGLHFRVAPDGPARHVPPDQFDHVSILDI